MKTSMIAIALLVSSTALAAPDEELLGKSEGYPACPNPRGSFSSPKCLVWIMSHYHTAFPSRAVSRGAGPPRELKRAGRELLFTDPGTGRNAVDTFLDSNRNTGLLVMRGDTVLAERYQYGRRPEDLMASMSMSKSVIGLLVGIALEERKIASLDDHAGRYVTELRGHPYGETAIRHLLTMSSGVKFEEVYNGKDDVMKLGTAILFQEGPGGAAAVLPYRERIAPQGQRFAYASSETFVLALVLRSATGRTVSDYLSERIWQPMGAEADAYWNIDPAGNEVGYCCLSATLRDWARLGLLLADGGARDGKQVIPAQWVKDSTGPRSPSPSYGYQFWVSPRQDRFALRGLRGQAIDVDPASRTVVVHTGVYGFGDGRAKQASFFDEMLGLPRR
jgi:CubicO group peptidase (beta-lactamase class C family)